MKNNLLNKKTIILIFAIILIVITIAVAKSLNQKKETVIFQNKSFLITSKIKISKPLNKIKYLAINGSISFLLNNISVDVFQNDTLFKGDILVLPGWNFKRNIWCDSSNFCSLALKKGFRLILPEMGKSIYSSSFYPETRKDWKKYPKLSWVTDSLIPFMQKKYGVFVTKKNYILGLSTGARGVILIGINTDTLFTKGAALSGDYNQTKMPNDNLITGYYGSYYKHRKRWEELDNPLRNSKSIKFDLYLGHGQNDKVVSFSQSVELYDSIKKNNKNINVILSTPNKKGHNFSYWRSEIDSILTFFEK